VADSYYFLFINLVAFITLNI